MTLTLAVPLADKDPVLSVCSVATLAASAGIHVPSLSVSSYRKSNSGQGSVHGPLKRMVR